MTPQLYSASTSLCVFLFLLIRIRTIFPHSSGIRSHTNNLLNNLVKNFIPNSPMHFSNFYCQLIWPNRFNFFHHFQCILNFFSTDTMCLFVNLVSSVLGSLSFSLFISFSKYSFHLFNTACKLIITLPFSSFITLMCCTSFPALSLCLTYLYNFFSPSFVSNLAYKS